MRSNLDDISEQINTKGFEISITQIRNVTVLTLFFEKHCILAKHEADSMILIFLFQESNHFTDLNSDK